MSVPVLSKNIARTRVTVSRAEARLKRIPERKPTASRTDAAGNRYEMRRLENGDRYEIVKNLLDEPQLARLIAPYGEGLAYREMRAFWVLEYRVR